jgi:hypothetical protein
MPPKKLLLSISHLAHVENDLLIFCSPINDEQVGASEILPV